MRARDLFFKRDGVGSVAPEESLGYEVSPRPLERDFYATYTRLILRYKYKLGYVKRGSTAFKVPKDGCGVPSAARALLGPEGLLMR